MRLTYRWGFTVSVGKNISGLLKILYNIVWTSWHISSAAGKIKQYTTYVMFEMEKYKQNWFSHSLYLNIPNISSTPKSFKKKFQEQKNNENKQDCVNQNCTEREKWQQHNVQCIGKDEDQTETSCNKIIKNENNNSLYSNS